MASQFYDGAGEDAGIAGQTAGYAIPGHAAAVLKGAMRKQRQTRIPEHLKAVKKGVASSSSSSSVSSGSSGASFKSKNVKSRTSPPKSATKSKLEAVIEAAQNKQQQQQQLLHQQQQVHSLSFPAGGSFATVPIDAMALGSPIKERTFLGDSAQQQVPNTGRTVRDSRQNEIDLSPVRTLPNLHLAQQQHGHMYASPERVPYSAPNAIANQVALAHFAETPSHDPYYLQFPTPQTLSNVYPDFASPEIRNYRPRTTSGSAGSAVAALPTRVFSTSATGAKTVASASSQIVEHRNGSVASSPASSMNGFVHPGVYSPISPEFQPSPRKRRNTASTTNSLSSVSSVSGGSAPKKSLTSLSSTSMSHNGGSMASVLSPDLSMAMSGTSPGMSSKATSPKTPGTAASSGMMLSISMTGKACITPRSELTGFDFGVPAPVAIVPELTRSVSMVRTISAAPGLSRSNSYAMYDAKPVQAPVRPGLLRSNTLDSRSYQGAHQNSHIQVVQAQVPDPMAAFISSAQPCFVNPAMITEQPVAFTSTPQDHAPVVKSRSAEFPSVLRMQSLEQLDHSGMDQPIRNSASMQPSRTSAPFYPDKQQLQTSWKFPTSAGVGGLNLSTSSASDVMPGSVRGSRDSSMSCSTRPGTAMTSAFPSMHSLNNSISAVNKDRLGPVRGLSLDESIDLSTKEAERRQSCIQAWLDSPDMSSDNADQTAPAWSTIPKEHRDVEDETEASSIVSSSSSSLDLAIRPSEASWQPNAIAGLPKSLTLVYDEEEDAGIVDSVKVSGKSIKPLKASRKRRYDDDAGGAIFGSALDAPASLLPPVPISTKQASNSGKASEPTSPIKIKIVARNMDVQETKGKKGRKNGKKGSKAGQKANIVGCDCDKGDNGEAMVQCDTCSAWYHLACIGLEDTELSDEWHCQPCLVRADTVLRENVVMDLQASYPSPASPVRQSIDLAASETPSTPTLASASHEPTFSHSATPKADAGRHFEDAHLVLAPIARSVMPTTPQQSNAYIPGHSHTQSLSRQYAPITPRLGYGNSSIFTPAPTIGRPAGAPDMWGSYAPSTPSNSANAHAAHSRRLSRNFRTPSNAFHWEDLNAPPSSRSISLPGGPLHHDDAERARQFGLFYPGHHAALPLGQSVSPPLMLGDPIGHTLPAFGSAADHHPIVAADTFLPPLDPEEVARQRFLELNSTPSRWGDAQRFPTMLWD